MNNTGTKYVRTMKQTAFEEKKKRSVNTVFKNILYLYLLNTYTKCNFRGYRCGTTTIVNIKRQKVN